MSPDSIKKIILFGSPLLLVSDILLFGQIVALVREASDLAVLAGLVLLCLGMWINYEFIKFIVKKFKSNQK